MYVFAKPLSPLLVLTLWIIAVVIPLLFFKHSSEKVLLYGEELIENQVQDALTQEMEAFDEDLKGQNWLRTFFQKNLPKIGFLSETSKLKYTFASGKDPRLINEKTIPAFLAVCRKELGCEPLSVFAVGCDSKESFVYGNPRFFSASLPPSKMAAQLIMNEITGQTNRRPLVFNDHVKSLQQKWGSDKSLCQKQTSTFVRQLFGEYVSFSGAPGEVQKHFTNKFGGGVLYTFSQVLTASQSAEAPLLGGLSVTFFSKTIPVRPLLAKARKNVQNQGFLRGYFITRSLVMPSLFPSFVRVGKHLRFFKIMPNEMTGIPLSGGKSLQERVIALSHPSSESILLGMYTAAPRQAFEHPLRRWQALTNGLAAFGCLGSLLLLIHYLLFGSIVSLKVRWKLLAGFAFSVTIPLAGFWISAYSYQTIHLKFENSQVKSRMLQDLQSFEAGIKSHESVILGDLWKLRADLVAQLRRSPEGVKAVLDKWATHPVIRGLYFLSGDGAEFANGELGSEALHKPGAHFTRDTYYLIRAGAVVQLLASKIPWLDEEFFQKKTWEFVANMERGKKTDVFFNSVFSFLFADEGQREQVGRIFMNDGRLIESPLARVSRFKLSYLLIPAESGKSDSTGGLLVVLFPSDRMGEAYFSGLLREGGHFRKNQGVYEIRYAMYKVDQKTNRLLEPVAYFQKDRELLALAQAVHQTGKDRVWDRSLEKNPKFLAGRPFKRYPFVGVGIAEPIHLSLSNFWSSLLVRALVAYSLFIVLLISGFLSQVLLNPLGLLIRGINAIRQGRFGTKVDLLSNDEFAHLGVAFNNMSQGLLERERMQRFVSEEVRQAVKGDDQTSLKPLGEKVGAAILFSDIRGFTTITEQHPPQEVVQVLNAYFSEMEPAIIENDGVIDKFIGDAIMAVFYPRAGQTHPVIRACQAGFQMRQNLQGFNNRREEAGLFPIENGIGIAYGVVISGKVGSSHGRLDYTVVGETVHRASQLESFSKFGRFSRIVVAEEALPLLKKDIRHEPLLAPDNGHENLNENMYELIF